MAVRLLSKKERPSPEAMTLGEHLAELRRRLVISVSAFLIAAVLGFILYTHLLSVLIHPYCQVTHNHCNLFVSNPLDGLTLRIKIAAFGGMILASPVILFQVWRFITPGLRHGEKKYAIPFVLSSIVMFLFGCTLAYITFPHALGFLESVGGPSLRQIYNPNQYLSLFLLLMLAFGLTFEFPVILVALQLVRIVTPGQLLRAWRWAVIGVAVLAAVITPSSDPFSMLAMAVPMTAFYFAAIGIGKLLGR